MRHESFIRTWRLPVGDAIAIAVGATVTILLAGALYVRWRVRAYRRWYSTQR